MKKRGFTLIELLAVIVILAIVSLIATPVVLNVMEKARRNSFQNSAYNVIKAGELYQALNDVIPEEGISIFDASFELSNKSQFKSGLIKTNGNEIILENVGTSSYCANGTTTNLKVTKGDCSTVDISEPVIKEIVSNLITSNSITVLVSAEDLESGINEYYYSIDNGTNYIKGNNNTYTFTGLKRNTEYSIKVKVVNGNKLETVSETKIVKTLNVEVPTYSINNSNPTRDNVIVTINYPSQKENGWRYEYKKDNNEWVEVVSGSSKTVEFSKNGSVIARIIDTTNEENNVEASIFEVSNIDKEGPIISSFNSNLITSSSVTLVTDAIDINGIKGYYYSKDGGSTYTDIQNSNTYTFSGLDKNKEYSFRVKVEDNLGNTTESDIIKKTTLGITAPTYSASTTDMTKNNVILTINYPSNKESTWVYEYKKDNSETWTEVTNGNSVNVTFTQNGTIIARIRDTANESNTVEGTLYSITNIDKTGPSITGFTTNNITSSTITLVTTSTDDTGIKGYYYSKDNGVTYTALQNSNTYTFTGLKKDTSYNFKVKVEDNVGNVTESNVVVGKTTNITTPSYSANITTPTNQDVTVTITYPTNKETNWEYQYIKNGGTPVVVSGTSTTVTFTENGSLIAKIVDKGNPDNTIIASTYNVSNIDKTGPSITTVSTGSITSSSIILNVTSTDNQGIKGYYYSKDGGSTYTPMQSGSSYTFTNLTKNTSYNFKVRVEDSVGNMTESNVTTGKTTNIPVPTYNVSTTDMTNQDVIVTINYPTTKESNWVYEYNKNDEGWKEVTENAINITFNQNGNIVGRIRDIGNSSNTTEASKQVINNIDKTGPDITGFITNSITSSSVGLVVEVRDTSDLKGYYYSKDNGATYTSIQNSNTYTFTGLSKNTSYNFKVKVEDNVGNVTESNVLAGKTTNIELPTYSASTTSVTNGNVVVTITYPSSKESNWEYQYVKDGVTTVVTGNSATVTFTSNGSVTAKIVDKGNSFNTVTASTYNVTNIDKAGPSITGFVTNSITSSTITLVTTATDSQGIKGYYYSKDNGATYTTIQNSNTYTFTGLSKNTSYNFKVKVEDIVGNVTTSNVVVGKTTNISLPTYSASTTSWTKNNVTVTINYPTNKESNWEYQYIKDGTTTVVSGTSATVTFTSNGSVTAKIVDKGNSSNTVTASTYNVSNIDKTLPSISVSPSSVTIKEGDSYNLMTGVSTSDSGGSEVRSTTVTRNGSTITSTSSLGVGTYTLTYTVSDYAGNTRTATRTLYVESKEYSEPILGGTDPQIGKGMIPITLSDSGVATVANVQSKWYDYANKKWANAVTVISSSRSKYINGDGTFKSGVTIPESDILTYLVWIPRYRYQLWNVNGDNTGIHTSPFEIQIQFENKNTVKSNGSTNGSWLTHPAFTFGKEELDGFWVGKFETGYSGANSTNAALVDLRDSSKVVIKPNSYSWRGLNVKNAFLTVQGMKNSGNLFGLSTSSDTHMMKNSEWGAVAYLSHSIYGINKQIRLNNNELYMTGCAASVEDGAYVTNCQNAWNTTIGHLASTTGNITGIYDMSGGAYEYVMGYTSGAKRQYGSSGFTSSDFPDSKYVDIYTATSVTQYSDGHLGDATKEVGPFFQVRGKWYKDTADFIDANYPWFLRGDSVTAYPIDNGIFAFFCRDGGYGTESFRVVMLGK